MDFAATDRQTKSRRACLLMLFLTLFFTINTGLSAPSSHAEDEANQPATRTIVDRMGRAVRIPAEPKRVACLFGPSYEKLFALGATDRVGLVTTFMPPWNFIVNPALKQMPVIDNYAAPSVEQLLSLGIDLVIYHPFAKQIQRMSQSGLPVVVPYDGSQRPKTLEGFFDDYYAQIRFYGEILGGPAKTTAGAYCRYMQKKIEPVLAVTREIPTARRPKVFYVCGRIDGLSNTQSRFSTADWLVTAAGGSMLTHEDAAYFVTVTTEELIAWNPDIIIVSTAPSTDAITKDPRLRSIAAVRHKRVAMSPQGLFYWSHFSSESFLCILFLAKQLHPDRFAHIDLKHELKTYYDTFYHYSLTDDEARRILNHLPPEAF